MCYTVDYYSWRRGEGLEMLLAGREVSGQTHLLSTLQKGQHLAWRSHVAQAQGVECGMGTPRDITACTFEASLTLWFGPGRACWSGFNTCHLVEVPEECLGKRAAVP